MSHGTEVGTTLLMKKCIPTNFKIYPNGNTDVLYFAGSDTSTTIVNGIELWKSNGTPEGTMMIVDGYPGTNSTTPGYITEMNGVIYFRGYAYIGGTYYGQELMKYDPNANSVQSLSVINKDLSIYPNPTTGYFIINNIENNSKIEVYNMIGEKVLEQQNLNQVDLSGFQKGIYVVKIVDKTKTYSRKIVVQ